MGREDRGVRPGLRGVRHPGGPPGGGLLLAPESPPAAAERPQLAGEFGQTVIESASEVDEFKVVVFTPYLLELKTLQDQRPEI